MKSTHLILPLSLLLLIFVKSSFAQSSNSFIGGHWYYTIGQIDNTFEISCIEIECKTDSIINGEKISLFDIYRKKANENRKLISREYIRNKNDTVSYKSAKTGEYIPIYSFNMLTGDTFKSQFKYIIPNLGFFALNSDTILPFSYVVAKKDSIWLGNKWRKRLAILDIYNPTSSENWCYGHSDTTYFIEGIGSTTYFFGQSRFVTGAMNQTKLRCFNQDSFLIKFDLTNNDCDYTFALGVESKTKNEIKVYFNNETIEIPELTTTKGFYKIYTITGQEVLNGELQQSISIQSLQKGIYVFILENSNNQSFTAKFCKAL